MQKIYHELSRIAGSENFFTDSATCRASSARINFLDNNAYNFPEAVIIPRRPEQLAKILFFCSENNLSVSFKGLGSSQVIRDYSRVLIIMTGLDRIYEIDRESRLAHADAGVSGRDLARTLAKAGLYLPFFPPFQPVGTIGGLVAVNNASNASLKYGPIGNFLRRIGVYSGDGRYLQFFSANGLPGELLDSPSLASIFAGSAGRFGAISDLWLRVLPLPDSLIYELYTFEEWNSAVIAVSELLRSEFCPLYLQYYDSVCASAILDARVGQPLLVVFQENGSSCVEIFRKAGGRKHALEESAFCRRSAGLLPALYGRGMRFTVERIAFPASRLESFFRALSAMEDKYNCELPVYGSAALANFSILLTAGLPPEIRSDLFALELMLNEAMQDEDDIALGRQNLSADREMEEKLLASFLATMDPGGILCPIGEAYPK